MVADLTLDQIREVVTEGIQDVVIPAMDEMEKDLKHEIRQVKSDLSKEINEVKEQVDGLRFSQERMERKLDLESEKLLDHEVRIKKLEVKSASSARVKVS